MKWSVDEMDIVIMEALWSLLYLDDCKRWGPAVLWNLILLSAKQKSMNASLFGNEGTAVLSRVVLYIIWFSRSHLFKETSRALFKGFPQERCLAFRPLASK